MTATEDFVREVAMPLRQYDFGSPLAIRAMSEAIDERYGDLLAALNGCLFQLELGNGVAAHIMAARAAIARATGAS